MEIFRLVLCFPSFCIIVPRPLISSKLSPICTEEQVSVAAGSTAERGDPIDEVRLWTAVECDWLLWDEGEKKELAFKLRPHHRTMTSMY